MCALCSGRSGGARPSSVEALGVADCSVVLLGAACSSPRPSAPGGPATTAGASTEPGRAVISPARTSR
jgi:hypothetical protein